MSKFSVFRTFTISIIFNVLLYSSDIGSDVVLVYNTVNFVGPGLELAGCRSCHHLTENNFNSYIVSLQQPRFCVSDGNFYLNVDDYGNYSYGGYECGSLHSALNRMNNIDVNNDVEYRYEEVEINGKWEVNEAIGNCEVEDLCCLSFNKSKKSTHNFKADDRITWSECQLWGKGCERCLGVGDASNSASCNNDYDQSNLINQWCTNEEAYFKLNKKTVRKSNDNETEIIKGRCRFDDKCCYRFKKTDKEFVQFERCNIRNSCQVHMRYVFGVSKDISEFSQWRKTTTYSHGQRHGGQVCQQLKAYGYFAVMPMLVHFGFILNLFIVEKRKEVWKSYYDYCILCLEVVLVILQWYGPYLVIQYLVRYLKHQDEAVLNADKQKYERDIGVLEPFVEAVFQVHISFCIIQTLNSFYPVDSYGIPAAFSSISQVWPILSFFLSLGASSFGTAKFFLVGPMSILPTDAPLAGLLSVPFIAVMFLNMAFALRVFSLEGIFFSHFYNFSLDGFNLETYDALDTSKVIEPLLPPEYRLMVYLAPCVVPILINFSKLLLTYNNLWALFQNYPQFFLSPGFTPFMFEGVKSREPDDRYALRVWKAGTVINSFYLCCLPPFSLVISDIVRGASSWKYISYFDSYNEMGEGGFYQITNSVVRIPYANVIIGTTTGIVYLLIILFTLLNERIFSKRGIYCILLSIPCCPCPQPCVSQGSFSQDTTLTPEVIDESISDERRAKKHQFNNTIQTDTKVDETQGSSKSNVVYIYTDFCRNRKWIIGQPPIQAQDFLQLDGDGEAIED